MAAAAPVVGRLPTPAIGFEILTIVYEHFLAAAGIAAGDTTPAAYQLLLDECDGTLQLNQGGRVEIALTRYFGLRANNGAVGAAFAARHPWPAAPPAAVQAYIAGLPPAASTPTLSLDATQTFYILGINDRANGTPVLHITIPRNPTGLGVGDWRNFTMHFTDENTRVHTYHPFASPRGPAAAAPAAAPAAAGAGPAAAGAGPPPIVVRPRPQSRWAAPTGPPPPGPGQRRGGRRKTKRSRRVRRTRRR